MELLRDRVVFFDPDWDMLRSPAPPGLPRRLVPSGQNLPWLALDLQNSDPGRVRILDRSCAHRAAADQVH